MRSTTVLGENHEHDPGIGKRRERGEPAVVAVFEGEILFVPLRLGDDLHRAGLAGDVHALHPGRIVGRPTRLVDHRPEPAADGVEPALGVAFIFVPMLAGMLLISGVRVRVLVISALLVLVFGVGLWSFGMRAYQRQRVMTFLQPDNDPLGAGYQVRQSKIAVGSGELLGKGYMQGTQSQLRFLPARHTDFILSVLAEEWGFLGVATVIGLYILYIVSAARVAMRARDRAGILLVVGLLSVFCFHVLYNSAMVVGFLPVTGIPLPFISYGGSFTLFNFLATGMILGVDLRRYVNR